MKIEQGDIWVEKSTGQRVLVLWVSNELVTYQTSDAIVPSRKFVFMQEFEELL